MAVMRSEFQKSLVILQGAQLRKESRQLTPSYQSSCLYDLFSLLGHIIEEFERR